jgi:hypothetical protein
MHTRSILEMPIARYESVPKWLYELQQRFRGQKAWQLNGIRKDRRNRLSHLVVIIGFAAGGQAFRVDVGMDFEVE